MILGEPEHISANRTFNDIAAIDVTLPTDDGALIVDRDNVTLDLKGAHLRPAEFAATPDQYTGRGIVVRGAKNVTLYNAVVLGFKVAIHAENAPGLTIENIDVSGNYRQHLKSTTQREHLDDWIYGHENDKDEWLRYGAGIYLKNCDGAVIKNCRARNGQNGICLVNCNDATVVDNDMSFMSGWGLALWRSSRSKVIGNRFDYCVRGYSHGVYARGQDSTGILVYEQCSDNIFAYNSATHGGDGFFLYAGHETTQRTGEGGCNRNIVYRNDFSHAIANGIEATFSDANVFQENKLHQCTHGVWGGYSTNSILKGNDIADCENGVSIEHGRGNQIEWNDFRRCGRGVWLWWDEDRDLVASPYGRRQGHASAGEQVRLNVFESCKVAIRAARSDVAAVEHNRFTGCETALLLSNDAEIRSLYDNEIESGLVENRSARPLRAVFNTVTGAVRVKGAVQLSDDSCADDVVSRVRPSGHAVSNQEFTVPPPIAAQLRASEGGGAGSASGKTASMALSAAHRHGRWPAPLREIPAGKEHILVDEWGPYDYRDVRIIAPPTYAMGVAQLRILGPGTRFSVSPRGDSVDTSPAFGVAPAMITIRPRTKSESASYLLDLEVGGARQPPINGVILSLDWKIAYFNWTPDQDPRTSDANWRAIIVTQPIRSIRSDRVDFVWYGRSPAEGVPTDRFAVVAETRLQLPPPLLTHTARSESASPGRSAPPRVRLKTISDDGVRVFLNGQKVIDNWTWHVPTEDAAEVVLKRENDLRIEYFEIDGHAQLQFFIEPVQ